MARRVRRSGLRLVARWWLSIGLDLVLLGVFPPCSCLGSVLLPSLCSFFFSGDVPKTDHSRLATAGVTFLLPDGRDVGSKQGAPTQEPVFSGIPFVFWHCPALLLQLFPRLQTTTFTDTGEAILTLTCCGNVVCYGPVFLGVRLPSVSVLMGK